MRVLVCGGRDYNNRDMVYYTLDKFLKRWPNVEIISGMARGADSLAYQWAKDRGQKCHCFPADWKKYKKSAGPIRNQQMINEGKPDAAVAFPGGDGTADMVARLNKHGIKTLKVRR